MELKELEAAASKPTKRMKRFAIRKLRKASKYAAILHEICAEVAEDRTILESEAYLAWMNGNLNLEQEKWKEALQSLEQAKGLYEGMAKALGPGKWAMFNSRVEEIEPSIRFCRYNLSRQAGENAEQLLSLTAEAGIARDMLSAKIDAALAEERKKIARSFGVIPWCGKDVAMRSEAIREAVISAREEEASLLQDLKDQSLELDKKAARYDKFFISLNESLQAVQKQRSDIKGDDNALVKPSQDTLDELDDVLAFLSYIRLSNTIQRNVLLIEQLKSKSSRHEDFVRIFDNLIQNTKDILELRGVAIYDPIQVAAKRDLLKFRAERCYYLALYYLDLKYFREAQALFTHSSSLAEEAVQLSQQMKETGEDMISMIGQSKRARMRAIGLEWMDHSKLVNDISKKMTLTSGPPKRKGANSVALFNNLDSLEGTTTLIPIPPELQPVSCKPLVFDLALDGVQFPPVDVFVQHEASMRKAAVANLPAASKGDSVKLSTATAAAAGTPGSSTSAQPSAAEPKKSLLSRLWGTR